MLSYLKLGADYSYGAKGAMPPVQIFAPLEICPNFNFLAIWPIPPSIRPNKGAIEAQTPLLDKKPDS